MALDAEPEKEMAVALREYDEMLELLRTMIEQQREKVLRIGRQLNPRLTADDVMNPFDWPEVNHNPQFSFEDGLLSGLISAHAAISARRAEAERGGAVP